MNPVHYGLEMLWRSVGMEMLEMKTSAYRLHGFCARSKSTHKPTTQICYVLNKYKVERKIRIKNPYKKGTKVDVEVLVDTNDHWGKVEKKSRIMQGRFFNFPVPGFSFVTMTFHFE